MPVEAAAECRDVVKIYWTGTGEVHALKGVDAQIRSGAVTAVVGPSGSGKSSLLRLFAAMDKPTAGSVRIGADEISGASGRHLRRVRQNVGYVFQRPSDNLMTHLTVQQHLELAARLRGAVFERDSDLLDLLGLGGRRDHRPHQLSGGEQQRVAFAQALVGDPILVVADEPTAELDSESSVALVGVMNDVARQGRAVVVSTHDPAIVQMADRTLYLRHGAMEAETHERRLLSVIDEAGRIQLPREAMGMFPGRRAVVEIDPDGVRITPP